MNSTTDKREPDPDAIKMFVGQIPRNMSENDLRDIFEIYGQVYQLNILRDKNTSDSKGCCFVTFYTRKAALDAQNALHNLKTLQGMHHPIQMKPADTENRNERKLFIGMISKNLDESSIRNLFLPYGNIEDCTILRDGNGKSRVVKFADTPKDKETKKMQQQFTNTNGIMQQLAAASTLMSPAPMNTYNFIPDIGNLVFLQQLLKQYGFLGNNGSAINFPALNNLLQMLNSNGNKQLPAGIASSPSNMGLSSQYGSTQSLNIPGQDTLSGPLHQMNSPRQNTNNQPNYNDSTLYYANNGAINGNGPNNSAAVTASSNGPLPPASTFQHQLCPNGTSPAQNGGASDTAQNLQGLAALLQLSHNVGLIPNIHSSPPTTNSPVPPAAFPIFQSPSYLASQVAGKPTEGPDGCNLFIYHLPQEYNDTDLAQAFAPFGQIISAKVFIDKLTNRSKCFGFVSFDNVMSAQNAITNMNGFQIGLKRLKVELKKLRNDNNTNHNNNSIKKSPQQQQQQTRVSPF
ncbi:unnamed protein product [Didymodactylos carnosus]|uniref:RRM domain-containing protein n=1 Tax=Didymodactylos carnosus TaxID=1234261 RepID=A0A8S2DE50_9BILA|nr:unnamed protein product [Didymodactylos carnosus]CAF3713526.1 unnamed protein product [Didymodactylos carnosus]